MIVPHSQDAELGPRVRIAAVNPQTGRHVVNLHPSCILPPLIALRLCGERWIDSEGHEWERRAGLWNHSWDCVCCGNRQPAGAAKR